MIELNNISKYYEEFQAVKSISLNIQPNEVFGLIGANGAGKSTLLLMIAGLIKQSNGIILLNGTDTLKNPIKAKKMIGYMPDDVGFYGNLTSFENLEFFAHLYEIEPKIIKERILSVLKIVKLENNDKEVGNFSKGMIQRLGIGKCLLSNPPILLLDEPTANLDPLGVLDFRKIIKNYAAKDKNIVIISSHIMSEVDKICTSIGFLKEGSLIYNGKISDFRTCDFAINSNYKIKIKCLKPIMELKNSDIKYMIFSNDRKEAIISMCKDVRDFIITTLVNNGNIPIEIKNDISIEEIFYSN